MKILTINESKLIEVAIHVRDAITESLRLSETTATSPEEILANIQALAEQMAPIDDIHVVTLDRPEYETLLNHVWQATVAARASLPGVDNRGAAGLIAAMAAEYMPSLAERRSVDGWPSPAIVADMAKKSIDREFNAAKRQQLN